MSDIHEMQTPPRHHDLPTGPLPTAPDRTAPPLYHLTPPGTVHALVPAVVYERVRTNTLALVSISASLIGLLLVPLIGPTIGVITGHIALEQMKETGEAGRGQALAGIMTGYVGIAFGVPALISFFAFLPLMVTSLEAYL